MNKSIGPAVIVLALGVAGFLVVQSGLVSSSTPVPRPAAPTLAQLAPAG